MNHLVQSLTSPYFFLKKIGINVTSDNKHQQNSSINLTNTFIKNRQEETFTRQYLLNMALIKNNY